MSEAIQSIGQFFNSAGGKGLLTAGTAGGGILQNVLANRQAEAKQKFVEGIITDPAKLQKFVSGFDKPLTAGLAADVARQTDAYGAERGLGSSPAVMKDVYAQSLAPFEQQQKNAAMQAALESLGIYQRSPTMKPIDVSSIFKALQMSGGTPPPSGPPMADPGLSIMQPSYMPGGGSTLPAPLVSADNIPSSGDFGDVPGMI